MIRRVARGLAPYVTDVRRRGSMLIVSSVFGGFSEAVALLLVVRLALSMNESEAETLKLPVLGYALSPAQAVALATSCAVLALAAHVWVASQSARLGSAVLASARSAAVRGFIDAGWQTQEAQREGALQETATTLANQVSWLSLSVTWYASQLLTLATFLILAFVADVVTTVAVVVLGIAIVAGLRPFTKMNSIRSQEFVEANIGYAEAVARMTSTAMELRVFGVQRAAFEDLESLNSEVRGKAYRARFISATAAGLLRDLAVLLLAVCIGVLVLAGSDSIERLGVAMALVIRSLASAQAVNSSWHSIVENVSSLEVFNARLNHLAAGTVTFGDGDVGRIESIEFEGVGFRYGGDTQALSDVAFRLEHGEALGVVGPSGGGKSTLVQVLLRLRPPTSGVVLVNGSNYRDIDDASWSAVLAFVPQEPTLIEGTVAENIRYYRDSSLSDVLDAATEANVFDDIMRMPNGFDTRLGARGTGLSGGQKQRVAIARALVGKPQLLVMDEPSSALDANSERILQETLSQLKGRTTMVIVAHRMMTLEACDRIMVIERGSMTQLGTPEELLGTAGFYRDVKSAGRP